MTMAELLCSRLLFVTGKGGVGKTSFSAAAGLYSSSHGRKTLIVEVDNFHPSMDGIFNATVKYDPVEVAPNLYSCNIMWRNALSDWLLSTVKVRRIVRLIERNSVAMLFLDATPGAREIVILSKIIEMLTKFDQVIVDLPASGHALGILRVPQTAKTLMKAGPVSVKSEQILSVFNHPTTALAVVALPEHMVVNESLEFSQKIRRQVSSISNVAMVLNRTTSPSLNTAESEVFSELKELEINHDLKVLIDARLWESELESATQNAFSRLRSSFPDVFSFPRFGVLGGLKGGPENVVLQMSECLREKVKFGGT